MHLQARDVAVRTADGALLHEAPVQTLKLLDLDPRGATFVFSLDGLTLPAADVRLTFVLQSANCNLHKALAFDLIHFRRTTHVGWWEKLLGV